jgi:hypothetical protein
MLTDKTSVQVMMGVAHHKVHQEALFILADEGANVQIATPKYWKIATPNTSTMIHFSFIGGASAACKIEMFETPTTSNDGTGLTPLNADRNSGKTASLLAYKDPAASVDGTLLASQRINASGGSIRISGEQDRNIEYILKKNTAYLIKMTVAANGTNVELNADWYEQDVSNNGCY